MVCWNVTPSFGRWVPQMDQLPSSFALKWRQHAPSEEWYECTKQDVTFQKAIIFTPSWAPHVTLIWKMIIGPIFFCCNYLCSQSIHHCDETCYTPSQYPATSILTEYQFSSILIGWQSCQVLRQYWAISGHWQWRQSQAVNRWYVRTTWYSHQS